MTVKEFLNGFDKTASVGHGGQKSVLKAEKKGKTFAVKLIDNVTDPRIHQEIEIMRNLCIDGVPRILETGILKDDTTGEDVLYIIEEFVSGRSLREIIKQEKHVTTGLAVKLMEKLLSIECEIEAKGIIHRDIKPENIMVSDEGKIFLIDFGIAKVFGGDSYTITSAANGPCTPAYAPVELAKNLKGNQDSRTDLYQIGLTIYEALSGKNPFSEGAANVFQVFQRTLTVIPNTIEIAGDSQGAFMQFINMLMAKNLSQRPNNAQEAKRYFEAIKPTIVTE